MGTGGMATIFQRTSRTRGHKSNFTFCYSWWPYIKAANEHLSVYCNTCEILFIAFNDEFVVFLIELYFTTTPCPEENGPPKHIKITSSNTIRFSKFFHCYNLLEISNKAVIKYPTTPHTRRYTTLWKTNVRKLYLIREIRHIISLYKIEI